MKPKISDSDWLHHYDYFDQSLALDPGPLWAKMRDRCPIAHSDRHGGYWIPTRYDDLRRIAQDHRSFSSGSAYIPPVPSADSSDFPPISMDPPEHTAYRRILLAFFTPANIQRLESVTRKTATELVARLIGRSRVDVGTEYAMKIPLTVISHMLGVDERDAEMFTSWILMIPEAQTADPEELVRMLSEMNQYLAEKVTNARLHPKDDIISSLLGAEIAGRAIDDEDLIRISRVLLVAGIDTTWTAIGSSLHHLAQYSDDRDRLVDALHDSGSSLWDTATEEFLRAFAPVSNGRCATKDIELNGCPIARGDRVLLPFGAANRDPQIFDEPDVVRIDRDHNPHLTFGVGVHHCLGASLARMELRVALQVFLQAIPSFSVPQDTRIRYAVGSVRGPKELVLTLG
jgi:cytochrome P450